MMRTLVRALVAVCAVGSGTVAGAATAAAQEVPAALEPAQRLFYSGEYEEAAAVALAVREADRSNLEASEIRTSALHFAIKQALGPGDNRERAWKACTRCQNLMSEFLTELHLGRTEARARLNRTPNDTEALFYLGKLDLNYVWLHLGTLGRRTGWSEYWEARRSLDAALALDPSHVRARVARAFMDYIVGTKVPRGARWILGGGNRTRGLEGVRDATLAEAPPLVQAEAMFALWDLQVRERSLSDAIVTARALARDFPANRELSMFLDTHDLQSRR